MTQFSTFATAEFLLLMQWTAPTAGIAMCQSVVAIADRRESAYGYEPTRAGLVETLPGPHDLHALITPPEPQNLTRDRRKMYFSPRLA